MKFHFCSCDELASLRILNIVMTIWHISSFARGYLHINKSNNFLPLLWHWSIYSSSILQLWLLRYGFVPGLCIIIASYWFVWTHIFIENESIKKRNIPQRIFSHKYIYINVIWIHIYFNIYPSWQNDLAKIIFLQNFLQFDKRGFRRFPIFVSNARCIFNL